MAYVKAATKASDQEIRASFQADLTKAKEATENAKGAMTIAANNMFAFYTNLLLVEATYAWNKIVEEQMGGDPCVHLQGISQKGPRGVSHQSFDDCMIFHFCTVFPINAAEEDKYYITNILKKPQHVNMRQFVCHGEQLNTYIAQMLCFYNSPSFNATTKPGKLPFMEAELGSHVLRMCPIQWQDQSNLHKKDMMPMNLRLLLRSLEAIERICTQEKAKTESCEKASTKGKNSKKQPDTKPARYGSHQCGAKSLKQ